MIASSDTHSHKVSKESDNQNELIKLEMIDPLTGKVTQEYIYSHFD